MSRKSLNRITAFLVALPFVFATVFFGYLPVHYDATFYLDNIVGEGTCRTYLSSPSKSFAYLYEADAYFGPELKTLKMRDVKFDVNAITLNLYNVEAVDLLSMDISVFGINISHINADGTTHPFTREISDAVESDESPMLHVEIEDLNEGGSITIDAFAFLPFWFWAAYFAFILLLTVLIALLLAHLFERAQGLRLPMIRAACILAALLMGAWFCGSFPYVSYRHFILNWLLFLGLSLLINAVSLPWLGAVVSSLFALIWYIANYYVISFRGKPIMPADLRAVRTAMEVVSGYKFTVSPQMIVGVIVVGLYIAAVIAVYRDGRAAKPKASVRKRILRRGALAVCGVLILLACTNNSLYKNLSSFKWDNQIMESFHSTGMALNYVKYAINSHVSQPSGYSRELVQSYLEEYEAAPVSDAAENAVQPTNIIMVMNEAFSDLRVVGLDERIDVMPFIDSLDENTMEGRFYVGIFGGGTCNTEFEGLTGNTLAFLPTGAYPYTEYVTRPLFSLASYLGNRDYETCAFHANDAQNWNRNMVYPNLGFNTFYDIEDYPDFTDETYLHDHPADMADYLFMEAKNGEIAPQPRFFFNVTMQNHSGYDEFLDVEEDETVSRYGGEIDKSGRVYLSLIKASDDAVRQLVETYRDSDEPTMIVFFGDHQPGMSTDAISDIYTGVDSNLELYATKFFIWTNYETETAHDVDVSANYLPWLILQRGNFPMPPYVRMLGEIHEKYPVISAMGVADADGMLYGSVGELEDDPLIRKYRYVQYANMFDELDPGWFEVK